MQLPNYHEDLGVLHLNTVPVHSYFIPTSAECSLPPDLPVREESDRMILLSGCPWLFQYDPAPALVPEGFFRPDYLPEEGWKEERVPFCWQMRGYDGHQYTNIRYPFPFDPPHVPLENPCGSYRRTFTWHRNASAPRTFLHFEGVDSCFYVWLNGGFLGYSQVTHHTSEFEVTDLLREGENLLAVLVLKWCDGSYLEDQDKFRMSGIIRDVYLVERPQKHIFDYCLTTKLSDGGKKGILEVSLSFAGEPVPVFLTLFGETRQKIRLDGKTNASFAIQNPRLWNAEEPNLYPLVLETADEVIRERVGFREVCVRDGRVLLNGSPIRFRGVNRHESDPVTGSVVGRDQVLRDLRMIKEHNFNAVRASHYPNVPYFYQLCDEIGLYVVDEADNESHGTAALYFMEDDYAKRMKLAHERIADNEAFMGPTLDRVASMVMRSRNRPSILVWSMGNECGYGCTFEKALAWTKETDPTRLTHYESAFYLPEDRAYDVSKIDLFGRMYPAFEEVEAYLAASPEKPLLLVEYCHSMGNSPGDFLAYRDLMEKNERACGGFVWEWCDHAVCIGTNASGEAMYRYGGDFGEIQHDGNFCLDGLVSPDRKPHPGLLEYKNVHRPLRAAYDAEAGVLTIRSYWDFLSTGSAVEASYTLTCDGEELCRGELVLSEIPAGGSSEVHLSFRRPKKGRCFLQIVYRLAKELFGLPEGHILGTEDIRIPTEDERNARADRLFGPGKWETGPVSVREENDRIIAEGSGFSCAVDRATGRLVSIRAAERELLKRPMDFNIWRAPTDNDRGLVSEWKWERLDRTVTRAYSVSWEARDDAVIRASQAVAAVSVQPVLRAQTTYRIGRDGTILVSVEAHKDGQIKTLPRIGLRLFLDGCLDQCGYYGIGPGESYIDKHNAGWHGTFHATVGDLVGDCIRPQESGSHFDCDWVHLTGGGASFAAAGGDAETFSFNASVYTQEELETKGHRDELEPCGDTVLCLDHKMRGIGSASCGPDLQPQYCIEEDVYRFSFRLRAGNRLIGREEKT